MGGSPSKDMQQMKSRDWNGAGKVAIVTGPTGTDIGFHTARWLAERGCHVVLAGRSAERLRDTAQQIRQISTRADGTPAPAEEVHLTEIPLDLGSLASVEDFVGKFQALNLPLNILVNNAGIMMTPYGLTKDGFEQQMGTNHVGHFHLTKLLLPQLRAAGSVEQPARVVNVASRGHIYGNITADNISTTVLHPTEKQYWNHIAYGNSKMAGMLHALEFEKRYGAAAAKQSADPDVAAAAAAPEADDRVAAFSLHPGVVATELGRASFYMRFFYWAGAALMKTAEEGAGTSVFCATDPAALQHRGGYFDRCAVSNAATPAAKDPTIAKALWDVTEREIAAAIEKRGQQQEQQQQPQQQ
jgi:NAD(P)-dependent dehydrogenase (short-subunit alcohol dehydrogenase family)